MKLCVQLLFLLTLTFLQESHSTHLETCECHKIIDLVNASVTKAVADLEVKVEKLLNSTLQASLGSLEDHQVNTVRELLKPIKEQLDYHLPHPSRLGNKDLPAASCKEIHTKYPQAPSGYYWIKQSMTVVKVYCSMTKTCGSETGGWMRVTNIDMRNTSQSCPSGLSYISSPKRLCDIRSGCVSNTFSVHGQQYSKVCGKIIAYQKGIPYAFYYGSRGIDRDYVYGVSLTHSQNPRRHIWTFAGASDETTNFYTWKCPCINTGLTRSRVPSFVGTDYFCDTALSQYNTNYNPYPLQPSDPLWDGRGCGRTNTCCSFNTPPWFNKRLTSSTTDNIEMRMCRSYTNHGSTPLEIAEIYVQ